VDDDVAEVDADAELDAAVLRQVGIAQGHCRLDLDDAAHRADHAGKLQQEPIAGRLYDPAAMLGDLRINEFRAERLQPAIAGDIGADDCRQPPVRMLRHRATLAVSTRRRYDKLGFGRPVSTPQKFGCYSIVTATLIR